MAFQWSSTLSAHAAWTTPEVIAQASAYLTGLPFAHPAEPPYEDASGQYRHLVDALHAKGTAPVRIELPLRGKDRPRPWWTDLAQGGVETYSIDCEHEEMMNVEPVLSIGKIVSDVFTRYGLARQSALQASVLKV